jgi:hypothetical protein
MAGTGQRIAIRKILPEVLRSGYMLQASGSTLASAMAWAFRFNPLVMVG